MRRQAPQKQEGGAQAGENNEYNNNPNPIDLQVVSN
jgi:hypothetical protein